MLGPDDFARVFVRVAPDEENEYVGEHLVALVAEWRYPRIFLAQLVLGSAMCVLYSGRLVQHWPFFPSLDARAVLYRCVESRHGDAEQVWNDLASLARL